MTYVLALCEFDFCFGWRVVCFGMPTNQEFYHLKKRYGRENLRFISDYKIVQEIISASDEGFFYDL